jgi:putative transposase
MDTTYIPMARGHVYLAVVLDWFSRRVLSRRVSITMEAAFCVETLQGLCGAVMVQRQTREVYLRADDSVGKARASIDRYLDFCNSRRPHSSLDGVTPDRAYFNPLPLRLAA